MKSFDKIPIYRFVAHVIVGSRHAVTVCKKSRLSHIVARDILGALVGSFYKKITTVHVGSLLHCVGRTFLAPARKVPKNRHGEALEPAAIQTFHVLLLPTPPQSRPPHDPSRHAARRRDSVVVVFIEGNRSEQLEFNQYF